ncbi:MAG: hypothetical protein LBS71_02960 [Puniceicoccales bacterium]|nr:hypothetical protein [Puniceicoccales bacterium]
MTSESEVNVRIRELIKKGKEAIVQQNEDVDKLKELKDKLSSLEDPKEFIGIYQELLQIKDQTEKGLSN